VKFQTTLVALFLTLAASVAFGGDEAQETSMMQMREQLQRMQQTMDAAGNAETGQEHQQLMVQHMIQMQAAMQMMHTMMASGGRGSGMTGDAHSGGMMSRGMRHGGKSGEMVGPMGRGEAAAPTVTTQEQMQDRIAQMEQHQQMMQTMLSQMLEHMAQSSGTK
jgi:hypothetical protein